MTSLSNTYNDTSGPPSKDPGRNKTGFLVMVAGVFLVFFAVILGTTPFLQYVSDLSVNISQTMSGVIGGLGAIAIVGGMLLSIPDKSTIETRIGLAGIVLCTFGVIWFGLHFPNNWSVYKLHTVAVVGFSYFVGMLGLLGITFHAVVNHRMKSTEKFTITHRFESETRTEPQRKPEPRRQKQDPQGGGVGLIGKLSPEARKTYGPRDPMTKEDREKHSLGSGSNTKRKND
jgi:hypothetical protein